MPIQVLFPADTQPDRLQRFPVKTAGAAQGSKLHHVPSTKGNLMTTIHITDEDVENGKGVLKRALIDARKNSLEPEDSYEPVSALGIALSPHVSFKNLLSLVRRKDEKGWHADFILKKVPEGFPDVFGTSSSQPLVSKREAYSQACEIVALLRQEARSGKRAAVLRKQEPVIVG